MYKDYKALAHVPLAAPETHRLRLITAARIGLVFVSISLAIGIGGYMYFEDLPFIDAFLNASMILSGMGPLLSPATTGGKVFAGIYAIFSGFAVLGIAAIVFAPLVHRIIHRLHIADTDNDPKT
jgi:hypothetical protein